MSGKEKYIGEAQMKGNIKKPLRILLTDKSVTLPKLADDVLAYINKGLNDLREEMIQMIESVVQGGVVLAQSYGNHTEIGISQKVLTETIQNINTRLNAIVGEEAAGNFTLEVNPTYFWLEDGADLHISAHVIDGVFDYLRLYVNDVLVGEVAEVGTYTTTIHIDETSTIKAVGSVFGHEYTKEKTIEKVEGAIIVGAGADYESVEQSGTSYSFDGTQRVNAEVEVSTTGQKIFVIHTGNLEGMDDLIITMNGFTVPMQKTAVSDSKDVYESVNGYQVGNYGIVIE